jgi:hypothetical protein
MREFYKAFYGENGLNIRIICLLKVYEYRTNQMCGNDIDTKPEYYD